MASAYRDSVLLEPKRFDAGTRTWNVPILNIRGVLARELYLNGALVPTGDYSIHGNHLALNETHHIDGKTRAQLVIEYNTSNILVKFWLPIILAVIGLLGAIGQPVLYQLGVLYAPAMQIETKAWGYDPPTNRFMFRLAAKNLGNSDINEWVLYVAVRKLDDAVDPGQAEYKYLAGPFELRESMNIEVPTDRDFAVEVVQQQAYVQGVEFLVKRGVQLQAPFQPQRFTAAQVRVLKFQSVLARDGAELPSRP